MVDPHPCQQVQVREQQRVGDQEAAQGLLVAADVGVPGVVVDQERVVEAVVGGRPHRQVAAVLRDGEGVQAALRGGGGIAEAAAGGGLETEGVAQLALEVIAQPLLADRGLEHRREAVALVVAAGEPLGEGLQLQARSIVEGLGQAEVGARGRCAVDVVGGVKEGRARRQLDRPDRRGVQPGEVVDRPGHPEDRQHIADGRPAGDGEKPVLGDHRRAWLDDRGHRAAGDVVGVVDQVLGDPVPADVLQIARGVDVLDRGVEGQSRSEVGGERRLRHLGLGLLADIEALGIDHLAEQVEAGVVGAELQRHADLGRGLLLAVAADGCSDLAGRLAEVFGVHATGALRPEVQEPADLARPGHRRGRAAHDLDAGAGVDRRRIVGEVADGQEAVEVVVGDRTAYVEAARHPEIAAGVGAGGDRGEVVDALDVVARQQLVADRGHRAGRLHQRLVQAKGGGAGPGLDHPDQVTRAGDDHLLHHRVFRRRRRVGRPGLPGADGEHDRRHGGRQRAARGQQAPRLRQDEGLHVTPPGGSPVGSMDDGRGPSRSISSHGSFRMAQHSFRLYERWRAVHGAVNRA